MRPSRSLMSHQRADRGGFSRDAGGRAKPSAEKRRRTGGSGTRGCAPRRTSQARRGGPRSNALATPLGTGSTVSREALRWRLRNWWNTPGARTKASTAYGVRARAAYRFMSAMAGNEPGSRSRAGVVAGNRDRFDQQVALWPGDVRATRRSWLRPDSKSWTPHRRFHPPSNRGRALKAGAQVRGPFAASFPREGDEPPIGALDRPAHYRGLVECRSGPLTFCYLRVNLSSGSRDKISFSWGRAKGRG